MRPRSLLNRWIVMVAAAAAGLVVGVPLAVPGMPAHAAVGAALDHRDREGQDEPSDQEDGQNPSLARDPTTVTITCGNGPIIVLPFTITTIHCEGEAEAAGRHAQASWS